MAKRKSPSKKKSGKKSRKSNPFQNTLVKICASFAILVSLVILGSFCAHLIFGPERQQQAKTPPKSIPVPKQPIAKIPTFEIYPPSEIPPVVTPEKRPVPEKHLPLVAIIIDDLGYDRKIAKKLSELNAVLTFSILPHSPFQKSIARLAKDKGFDIMLHLPMEPVEYPQVNPGPGTLLVKMTPDELIRQLEEDLKAVPFAKGVNNHMGSKMTSESNQLYQIFSILKKRNLFFIDSRTTAASLCKPSARLFQIPFAQRDVFLDHLQEDQFVRQQLKQLVLTAQRNGFAVGIGHPHLLTYQILHEMLPEIQKLVQLVPASRLVHPVG